MAKYEREFCGDFDAALAKIHDAVMNGSYSASYEDGSDYGNGDFRCAVRVYERYSAIGGNRVSLNITLFGGDGEYRLSAITSGGTQSGRVATTSPTTSGTASASSYNARSRSTGAYVPV